MLKSTLCLLAGIALVAAALAAAEPSWKQVQELKSGSELKIYKRGSSQPILATFADANEDRIVVATKNEEMAIRKEDIDRIEARPPAKKTRGQLVTTTTARTVEPDYTPHPQPGINVPGTSYGTSVSRTSSGDAAAFETVYRRPADQTSAAQQ